MGFFDLFRSKETKSSENGIEKLNSIIFPGGQADIAFDCQRINNLTNKKIPRDELTSFVAGCKALVVINNTYDDEGFIQSFIIRSNNQISTSEARDVYVFLAGESMIRAKMSVMSRNKGGVPSADVVEYCDELAKIWASGVTADQLVGGRGEFGLVVDNPIPTVCIKGSDVYLSRLRHQGKPVEFTRVGSASSTVTKGSIDVYELSQSGSQLGRIFICPYHRKDSKKAPKGFALWLG
jgi:hypothetical protein